MGQIIFLQSGLNTVLNALLPNAMQLVQNTKKE